MDIQGALARLAEGKDLSQEETRRVFQQVMSGSATPAQIGGLAVFLCSPSADQITGAPLSIDGGWMAQ